MIIKCEYEYLVAAGCDIEILDAYYLCCYNKQYPYRKEIDRLVKLKSEYKLKNMDLDYHTVKIIMNSFYGKFVQLIEKEDYYEAGSSWNPIYGSVITANTRVRISDIQARFDSVVAVHTDSVLSTLSLPILNNESLGDYVEQQKGKGIILGSGIYQIGNKTKFRGMNGQLKLMEILSGCGKFEVTTKGPGYYYEYDIVSAYPFEIRNLVDISWARVVREKAYRKNAIYGFLKCKIRIPMEVYSPVAVKRNNVNCYAVGAFEKVITKCEYEYL